MNAHHRVLMLATLAVALAIRVVAAMQSGGAGSTSNEWPAVGGDGGNTRYSTLAQLTTSNVTKLGAAWTTRLDNAVSSRAMTVVKDGMIFVTASPSVYAFDVKTGARMWRFQTSGGRGQAPTGMGAPGREGVAVAEGMVFAGLSDARVIALNEKTGQLVWNKYFGDNPRDKGQVASGAPMYAGGLISIGLSADNGWRGQVVAFDPKTGNEAWRFHVIPAPGEKGHETWPQNSTTWERGGGAVWLVGASEPDQNTIYYVTG